jgi:GAF domain-containing protein
MPEKFLINSDAPKDEIYSLLLSQIESLITKDEKLISNLANFTAALMQSLKSLNWVGFYIAENEQLYLGPFQGKVACTKIDFGKGVCGTAAVDRETIIVPNVYNFPGHIFCDSDSKSEIVIPIVLNNTVWGVLDLDSPEFNRFDITDKMYLELLVEKLKEIISSYELFSNSKKVASATI